MKHEYHEGRKAAEKFEKCFDPSFSRTQIYSEKSRKASAQTEEIQQRLVLRLPRPNGLSLEYGERASTDSAHHSRFATAGTLRAVARPPATSSKKRAMCLETNRTSMRAFKFFRRDI